MSKKVTNTVLIVLAYASLFTLGFLDNLRSPYFSSFLSDIKLNDVDGSFFFIVPSSMGFVGSMVITQFTKRWAIRTNLLVMTLLMCFGFALLSLVTNFWSMVAFCAVYGLAMGFSNTAQNIGVHEGASANNRRRMFGGLQSMYAIASFSSPFLAGWLFEAGVHWQSSFRMAALACATVVLSIFLFGYLAGRDSSSKVAVSDHQKLKTTPPKKKELWIVSAPMAFYLMGEMSISTRLALYLERDLGYTKENAAFWLAMFFALFTIGRVSCWLIDTSRWSQPQILKWCSSLACVSYALGLFVHPLFLILSGLFMAPFYPTAVEWLGYIYREHADRALSIGIGFGYLIVVLMHFTLGQISEGYGLRAALWIGPAGLLITALSLKLSLRTLSQK